MPSLGYAHDAISAYSLEAHGLAISLIKIKLNSWLPCLHCIGGAARRGTILNLHDARIRTLAF
jgi:hypothetical protein